ncbi:MAG TPA: type III effector protein [Burkholderiaceae bacterium]|nr:type III effector protein [Burkholderiaceae bacterium]
MNRTRSAEPGWGPGALAGLGTAPPRRTVSHPAALADPAQPAPALHQLIGLARAQDLDARFGSLQPVRTKDGEGIHPWERDAAGKPLTHARRVTLPDRQGRMPDLTSDAVKDRIDLDALRRGDKRYVWAVGALGQVHLGEEEPVGPDPQSGRERHRGHPLLVAGGPARVCGEITHDAATGEFEVRNKSGRYARYEDRTEQHLHQVRGMLAEAGLDARPVYLGGKAREPLVLPNLDPAFKPGEGPP